MIQCKQCQYRTGANSCAHLLAEVGGIHWCEQISECDAFDPVDHTVRHMETMVRLITRDDRAAYLDRLARAEGPIARQRLETAFRAWWDARKSAA
jgi:hypothetical protein